MAKSLLLQKKEPVRWPKFGVADCAFDAGVLTSYRSVTFFRDTINSTVHGSKLKKACSRVVRDIDKVSFIIL